MSLTATRGQRNAQAKGGGRGWVRGTEQPREQQSHGMCLVGTCGRKHRSHHDDRSDDASVTSVPSRLQLHHSGSRGVFVVSCFAFKSARSARSQSLVVTSCGLCFPCHQGKHTCSLGGRARFRKRASPSGCPPTWRDVPAGAHAPTVDRTRRCPAAREIHLAHFLPDVFFTIEKK